MFGEGAMGERELIVFQRRALVRRVASIGIARSNLRNLISLLSMYPLQLSSSSLRPRRLFLLAAHSLTRTTQHMAHSDQAALTGHFRCSSPRSEKCVCSREHHMSPCAHMLLRTDAPPSASAPDPRCESLVLSPAPQWWAKPPPPFLSRELSRPYGYCSLACPQTTRRVGSRRTVASASDAGHGRRRKRRLFASSAQFPSRAYPAYTDSRRYQTLRARNPSIAHSPTKIF
ncbi:uncharacterized protein LAESUDRAFT_483584 [Laetiporus sulphureus 93-53]|uniref:Uncharacterized protein n=1 Tax=Laetiporus sulphureus 93-53 TaxID=1314785 RepID=A0A165BPA5_9APHY|nr:uncharacterized protein LAESUDRAFT_483584 [Laetiporus sulphureus 93-53]KZT01410.1 hypothetical protein LAESUDRAFT_483584 [Laetiporus sulphureus 93-53]